MLAVVDLIAAQRIAKQWAEQALLVEGAQLVSQWVVATPVGLLAVLIVACAAPVELVSDVRRFSYFVSSPCNVSPGYGWFLPTVYHTLDFSLIHRYSIYIV